MLIALLVALMVDGPVPADQPVEPPDPPAAAAQQAPAPPLRLPTFGSARDPDKALRFVWREHPSIRAGRNLRLDFSVKIQEDLRHPGDHPVPFPTWELQRARAGVDGELFRKIQFSVEREFSESLVNDPTRNATKSQWKDVYVELNLADAIQVRGGKFKVPFGLDQTSGESNLDFAYRSLGGDYLSPGRDIGGMAHGRFFTRGLNYWVGAFKQDGDNSRSSKIAGGDVTLATRVTATVFRKAGVAFLRNAEVGGSLATSELSDASQLPNGLRGRTMMSQFTFFEPVFVKGTRRRYGAEIDVTHGPFGGRAEYILVSDTRDGQGIRNEDLSDVRGKAWYVLGSWVLTGETKERPVPARKGGIGRGGIGALELTVRYDALRFDSKPGQDPPFRNSRAETIFPNGDKVFTGGFTYYANRWVKIQGNAIHENIEDLERSPTPTGKFWSTVLRFQFEL